MTPSTTVWCMYNSGGCAAVYVHLIQTAEIVAGHRCRHPGPGRRVVMTIPILDGYAEKAHAWHKSMMDNGLCKTYTRRTASCLLSLGYRTRNLHRFLHLLTVVDVI